MRPENFPLALLTFLGFVAVMPLAIHYLDVQSPSLPPEATFLAGLTLPMMALLFLASWLTPRGG